MDDKLYLLTEEEVEDLLTCAYRAGTEINGARPFDWKMCRVNIEHFVKALTPLSPDWSEVPEDADGAIMGIDSGEWVYTDAAALDTSESYIYITRPKEDSNGA